jgi:hypothetical protein
MRVLVSFLISFGFVYSWAQTPKNILKKYPKDVQKILLTEENVFRGLNFGDSRETVKNKEKARISFESDTMLIFTLFLDTDDSADLIYTFDDEGKADGFSIIFILADREEELMLRKNLMKFYTEKYGLYEIINEEDEIWDTEKGYKIEMRDTSDEAGMEIEVVYYR